MRPSETARDVRSRRPMEVFYRGRLKGGTQKARRLGQDFDSNAYAFDKVNQNCILAHLLKGGLYISHIILSKELSSEPIN